MHSSSLMVTQSLVKANGSHNQLKAVTLRKEWEQGLIWIERREEAKRNNQIVS